jgi:hypothetical protein
MSLLQTTISKKGKKSISAAQASDAFLMSYFYP